jgi:PiT family inorganic phosphate transporter
VIWAAFFNFIAFVVFPLHVAHTIGKGIIDPKIVDDAVLFGALGGAIAWNLITWFYGLPSSSSHALVGGLIGAGFCKGGSAVIQSGVAKTALFIVISPVLGWCWARSDGAVSWLFGAQHPGASIAGSGGCSSCRRRCSAWATAPTTRRRRWASSWRC